MAGGAGMGELADGLSQVGFSPDGWTSAAFGIRVLVRQIL
jgi:hypothetical protein